jgi:hypothetical protein
MRWLRSSNQASLGLWLAMTTVVAPWLHLSQPLDHALLRSPCPSPGRRFAQKVGFATNLLLFSSLNLTVLLLILSFWAKPLEGEGTPAGFLSWGHAPGRRETRFAHDRYSVAIDGVGSGYGSTAGGSDIGPQLLR